MQAMPPTTQTASMTSGAFTPAATVAGTMKMPEPIMVPTTMAVMLPAPRQRTKPGWAGPPDGAGPGDVLGSWLVMRLSYVRRPALASREPPLFWFISRFRDPLSRQRGKSIPVDRPGRPV